MSNPRISGNSVTYEAPIVLYANSPERTHLNPRHVMIVAGSANRSRFSSNNLTYDDFSGDVNVDLPSDPSRPNNPLNPVAPSVSDITVISKTVVYDAAGKPSVTVVFKIKNSSGGELKAINARVSQ